MCPNHNINHAILNFSQQFLFFLPFQAPSQQFNSNIQIIKLIYNSQIMLCCQNFCRCHYHTLISIFNNIQKNNERNYCFPRSNISLNQPIHNLPIFQFFINFSNHSLLSPCQFIIQTINKFSNQPFFIFQLINITIRLINLKPILQNPSFQKQNFLQHKSPFRPFHNLFILRKMNIHNRPSPTRQILLLHQFFRNIFLQQICILKQCLFHNFPNSQLFQ